MKPRSTAPAARRLLGDKEGAPYLGISRSQFRSMVAADIIPRVEVPGVDGQRLRRLLVDRADLDRLIERWKRQVK